MRQIDLLWELQGLDTRIGELEKELEMYEKKKKLWNIKRKFDREKRLLQRDEKAFKKADMAARGNRTKVEELKYNFKKTEEKLYSGEVSNMKQLEGMQRNLEEMQRNIETLEGAYGDYKKEKERLEKRVKKSRSKLLEYKNTFDDIKEEYIEGEIRALEEHDELSKQRNKFIKKIDKGFMDRYERVRQGIDTAIVTIEGNKCSGCHMEVSVVYSEMLKDDVIVNCETCGRILYPKNPKQ